MSRNGLWPDPSFGFSHFLPAGESADGNNVLHVMWSGPSQEVEIDTCALHVYVECILYVLLFNVLSARYTGIWVVARWIETFNIC